MIDTPKSAKNWYLAHSFNSDYFDYNSSYLGKNYVLASIISDDLYFELKTRLSGEYLGTNLEVRVSKSGVTEYFLLFYKGRSNYDTKNPQINIGYLVFPIVNYTVDYEKYLNSEDYVPLTSLTISNLVVDTDINFFQGYNQKNQNFNNTGSFGYLIKNSNNEGFYSNPSMITYNGKFKYEYSSNSTYIISPIKDWTNYFNTNPNKYKYYSRTPSTWKFGISIMNQLSQLAKSAPKKK